jgi:hypothetical protein
MDKAGRWGAISGIVLAILVFGLNAAVLLADPGAPGWSVTPGDFDYDGSIVAVVLEDATLIGGAGDLLGAFVGDECRGVEEALQAPDETYIFFLKVFSDSSSGEYLSFKHYDAAADTVHEIVENIEFITNMTVGSALDPFEMHTSGAPAIGPTTWGAIRALYH